MRMTPVCYQHTVLWKKHTHTFIPTSGTEVRRVGCHVLHLKYAVCWPCDGSNEDLQHPEANCNTHGQPWNAKCTSQYETCFPQHPGA